MLKEKRKRRRELAVTLASVILIVIIFLVEYRTAQSVESIKMGGHLLLFGLLSTVILLLILVIFFIIRNVFKLIFERRQKVLGSHLKTRCGCNYRTGFVLPREGHRCAN